MKMKKIEKKLAKLEEKKLQQESPRIDKKIMKLEKKKVKLEKWLKIKLPFRILIKGLATWLIIGGVCFGCSYIPVVKEAKMAFTGVVAYATPEPVSTVLDVVTLNIGASNKDFEWLKSRISAYVNGEVQLETYNRQYEAEEVEKVEGMVEDVMGTTSVDEINQMSIENILNKIVTNSSSELVSQILDMSNFTDESRKILEDDINKALKIVPKLNNNQMNELIDIITKEIQKLDSGNQQTEKHQTMEMETIS